MSLCHCLFVQVTKDLETMITTYFQKKKSSRKDGDSTFSSDKSGLTEDVPDKNSACKRLRTDDACPLASNRDLPPLDKPYTDKNDDKNDSIQSLISHLTEDSWRTALMSYVTSKNNFTSLAQFVDNERRTKTVYPSPEDTFSALNTLPLQKVKVVIVGQDPYHQPKQGHGLAFSVRKGIRIPPSLLNIYKELRDDDSSLTKFPPLKVPTHGYLERWARQGVLLLNTVLTVRFNEPNSHAKKGWEQFTDEVIRVLLKHTEQKDGDVGIVFLLWGAPAQNKLASIIQQFSKKKHTVITSSHPSPLGASKTHQPFLGSKCFSRVNDALIKMKVDPIDWDVDD